MNEIEALRELDAIQERIRGIKSKILALEARLDESDKLFKEQV